jgi:nucleotide-binding universal stress UspA family protein
MNVSILVPLDGSRFSAHALPVALDLVRRTGGVLHLAHVHAPPLPPTYFGELVIYDSHWEEQLREEARQLLREAATSVRGHGDVAVVTALLEGEVVPSLAGYADRHDVDTIVMTTHGRGGISRAWLGSTADGLIRQTHRPLLLVRPEGDDAPDQRADFRRILVPLDGSDVSEDVLEPALALARRTGAALVLLRVCTPVYVVGRPFAAPASVRLDSGEVDRKQEQAKRYLEGLAAQLGADGQQVETAVVLREQAAPAILDFAVETGADLIAMATNGRSGWSRLALGSVADKVVRGSPLPVMVLRPPAAAAAARAANAHVLEHPVTV